MTDRIRDFADSQGLGRAEVRVGLSGRLEVASGHKAAAELWLTPKGLWCVAAHSRRDGLAIALTDGSGFSYKRRRLGAALVIRDQELGIPPGRAAKVQHMIAVTRLRPRAARIALDLRGAHLGRSLLDSEPEQLCVRSLLEADETALAWLQGRDEASIESVVDPEARGPVYLFVTDRSAALVALSSLGDVRVEPLSVDAIDREQDGSTAILRTSEREWRSRRSEGQLAHEALAMLDHDPARRLREVARFNWLHRDEREEHAAFSRALLRDAAKHGDPLSPMLILMTDREQGRSAPSPELEGAMQRVRDAALPDSALAQAWESFELTPDHGERLVRDLRKLGRGAEPWCVALHRRVRRAAVDASHRSESQAVAARADIHLAEHLMETGQVAVAHRVLRDRLNLLPSEALEDLLPPRDADLTAGAGGQALHIRIRELLVETRDATDVDSVCELARLQPLVIERVARLAEVASGDLQSRANEVLALLGPGGLERNEHESARDVEPTRPPFTDKELSELLPHPLARQSNPFSGKLEALLASVPMPDRGMLRDYCERLDAQENAPASRVLNVGCRMLGVSGAQAYVSRGNKSVGVRGYEDDPPFVLIGGKHLNPTSSRFLTPHELCFALGSELAHLRYGHTRVTSSEVWAGAFAKTRDSLDFALNVLPMLKGWRAAGRFGKLLSGVQNPQVSRLLKGAADAQRFIERVELLPRSDDDAELSRINEQLIAAHRVMQLTADRAGLVVTGDLRAAVRALLLVRSDYRALLDEAHREGLEHLLGQRDPSGKMQHQDLAVRLAALFSFFLSEDYAALRFRASST